MISLFIDSSVDNVLLQTNSDFSHFLVDNTSARRPNQVIDRLVRTTDLDRWNLLTFSFISTHTLLDLLSPGSAEADIK